MSSSPSKILHWGVAHLELFTGMPLPSLHLPLPTQPSSRGAQQEQENLSQQESS